MGACFNTQKHVHVLFLYKEINIEEKVRIF